MFEGVKITSEIQDTDTNLSSDAVKISIVIFTSAVSVL